MKLLRILAMIDLAVIGLLFIGIIVALLWAAFKIFLTLGSLLIIAVLFGFVLSYVKKQREKKTEEPEIVGEQK